ncbi:MAG TPA: hypothetical protein VEY30_02000 [Myxococcaceae bacterium]|nr:hypothetical protein [Myxococcaceae bacterium]
MSEEAERQERIRELRSRLGPLKGGIPEHIFKKMPEHARILLRMHEGKQRIMPYMPRNYQQAVAIRMVRLADDEAKEAKDGHDE